MVTYIYFVKCPNCEDEPFDFFDEAKAFALGRMGQKPIITQVEVERNDFGECTDSCDLGTVWSWEDIMGEDGYTDTEPTKSIFTKDDLKPWIEDEDPEFEELDNSVDFKLLTEDDREDPEYERRHAQAQRGYNPNQQPTTSATNARANDLENRYSRTQLGQASNRAPSAAETSMRDNDLENRASRTQLGYDSHKAPSKAETSARDNDLENRDAVGPDTKTISKILVKYSTLMPYTLYDKLSGIAPQVLKAKTPWWLKSPGDEAGQVNCVMTDGSLQDKSAASKQGLRPVIEVIPEDFADDKLYAPVKAMNGDWIKISDKYLLLKEPIGQVAFDSINTLSNDFDRAAIKKILDAWSEKYFKSIGAVFGSGSAEFQKALNQDKADDIKKRESIERKPIPEGMTVEQLVEEMEKNEDEVECALCQELFPKSDCYYDEDEGHICPECRENTVKCTWCGMYFDPSECRKEVDLGWLCSRCEAAIKSRGETLTFKENNYWDFLDENAEPAEKKTWLVFNRDNPIEVGEVYANTEEEAVAEAERKFPGLNYNDYDGAVQVVPADENLNEATELHDLGNEYDGGYPEEEPELPETDEVSDSYLKLCPECGKETFDIETGICVECGFN